MHLDRIPLFLSHKRDVYFCTITIEDFKIVLFPPLLGTFFFYRVPSLVFGTIGFKSFFL